MPSAAKMKIRSATATTTQIIMQSIRAVFMGWMWSNRFVLTSLRWILSFFVYVERVNSSNLVSPELSL